MERLDFFFLEGLEFSILEMGCKLLVVGPAGGRISTGDCSRVLNVNRSLSSSTSRGRVQAGSLHSQNYSLRSTPTCTTVDAPVYV